MLLFTHQFYHIFHTDLNQIYSPLPLTPLFTPKLIVTRHSSLPPPLTPHNPTSHSHIPTCHYPPPPDHRPQAQGTIRGVQVRVIDLNWPRSLRVWVSRQWRIQPGFCTLISHLQHTCHDSLIPHQSNLYIHTSKVHVLINLYILLKYMY